MDKLQAPASRYISPAVQTDLARRMVFIGGPRQVGKTTLGLKLLNPGADESDPAYFNWDNLEDRRRLTAGEIPAGAGMVVLDEIHKYARWRNFLKGLYDKRKSRLRILVTGSARLDFYRRGGDSLFGRYHYHRLHPFSLMELDPKGGREALEALFRFGGFPEPLFAGDETRHRRWVRERHERVVKEDLRDLENVKEISLIEQLLDHLPACVGSPLSVGKLRTLLGVAHETVERWLEILERLYLTYRITPYGSAKIRAVRKERKLYFWDWTVVPEPGPRMENFVASHLLKYCHWKEDTRGYRMELRHLRDHDKREVDFVVLCDGRPEFAVECKTGERAVSPAAAYFKERTPIPAFYQVHLGARDYVHASTGIRVLPFPAFARELALP